MAIILLAIGAILSAIGLYAIVSGYPMIEIERGWASVIAGSVLLSGGIVVVALGLVLRALTRMRAEMPSTGVHALPDPAPAVTEPSFAPIGSTPHQAPPLGTAVPALAVAAPAVAAAVGHDARPDAPAPVTAPEPEAAPAPAYDAPEPHATVSHAPTPAAEPPANSWGERDLSAFDYEAAPEAHAPPAETPYAEPVPRSASSTEEKAPEPAPPLHEPDVPSLSDEDFSHPKFRSYEVEEHEPETDEPAAHAHEHAGPAHVEHAAEPVAEAPATAPESPPANLSVIGRYDSEGTSYVMYSDGSIEAQSDAGVYRFGSMAELKAFIEG